MPNQLIAVFNAIISLANAFTELGSSVMSMLGLPRTIDIGQMAIETGGLFNVILTIIIFFGLMDMFSRYWKLIALACGIMLLLSIIGAIF